jgi:prophage regulatory protein
MHEPTAPALQPGDRLIRREEVERLTGLSRSSIYWRNQHDPEWPKAIPLGPNTVAWIESEVLAWASRQVERARRRRA